MPTIGVGAKEIRIHQLNEYRVIFVATFPEAIYLLHAFVKRTKKTSKNDIERARTNHAEMQQQRRNQRTQL